MLFACTDLKDDMSSDVRPEENMDGQTFDALSSHFAMTLSKAISENSDLRFLLKSEAMKMFDGDFDILLKDIKDLSPQSIHSEAKTKANGTISFGEIVGMYDNLQTKGGNSNIIETLSNLYPNYQIAVPVHCEEWLPEEYSPLVAFLPADYDDSIDTEISAFDRDGNTVTLSLEETPDKPVIVVSISERVDRNGNLIYQEPIIDGGENADMSVVTKAAPAIPSGINLLSTYAQTLELEWTDTEGESGYEVFRNMNGGDYSLVASLSANHNYYVDTGLLPSTRYGYRVRAINADGPSAFTTVIATYPSSRNDGERLKVKKMYFTDSALRAVEKWASGAPEIRLRVAVGNNTSSRIIYTSGRMEPRKRADIDDKWWDNTIDIGNWYTASEGSILTFNWMEEDPSALKDMKITPSFEVKLGSWAIKLGVECHFNGLADDDLIGETVVHWWDTKSQIYDISGFKWQFEY